MRVSFETSATCEKSKEDKEKTIDLNLVAAPSEITSSIETTKNTCAKDSFYITSTKRGKIDE